MHKAIAPLAAISLLLAASVSRAEIDTTKAPYNIEPNVDRDQSQALQAALDEAAKLGGGKVVLPSGTLRAQGLALPGKVTLCGQGIGATVLKLPDNADTFVIASKGFARNQPWSDMYGGLRDLTLDGNKAHNKTGSLLVIKTYRLLVRDCQFRDAPLHGILWTSFTEDGTPNKNDMAEIRIINCSFDNNAGAGIYVKAHPVGHVADGMIYENNFNHNGELGFYQIDLERSAGFHIVGNQMYSGGLGDLRALAAGALIVRGNNFYGSQNAPADGRVRQVVIRAGGWGTCVIAANLFHNHAKQAGPWTMLDLAANADDAISVCGNVFRSEHIEATPYSIVGRSRDSVILEGNALPRGDSPPRPAAASPHPAKPTTK